MLLTEDPNQRLGARGAKDAKQHPFFRDINWDTLARQKAAFVPASENALDTSYFTSRFSWNPSDERVYAASEFEDSRGRGSVSGSSSCLSNCHDELVDECGGLAEFESGSSINYSFSKFSFKLVDYEKVIDSASSQPLAEIFRSLKSKVFSLERKWIALSHFGVNCFTNSDLLAPPNFSNILDVCVLFGGNSVGATCALWVEFLKY